MTHPTANALIAEDLDRYHHDPLGFVRYAYPWGRVGTSLEHLTGPQQWAVDLFEEVRESLERDPFEPIQMARASGKGITKSATAAQLAQWAMCTHPNTRGLITANTEQQLRTRTWPEFMKWFHLLICRRWFSVTETVMRSAHPEYADTWKFDRVTWSEHNLEAAQGLHNQGRRIITIFDEASNIADAMWDATDGVLTDRDTEILQFRFGNPTRNVGRFHQVFHDPVTRRRWNAKQIDSRTTTTANHKQIAKWLADFGEDDDRFRIWVRGMFPARAANQLIAMPDIEAAATREATSSHRDALVIGIDAAREGDDDTVIRQRRGRDARTWPSVHLPRAPNGDAVAETVSRLVAQHQSAGWHVDALFVDCTGGYGWSIFDSLVRLGYAPVACNFAEKATRPGLANKRMEIYADLERWLATGGAIPNDERLKADLAAQQYTHDKLGRQILIDKDDIKLELGRSPDDSDALALTFWTPVTTRAQEEASRSHGYAPRVSPEVTDYNPLTGQ